MNKWLFGIRRQSLVLTLGFGVSMAAIMGFYTLPNQAEWINDRFTESANRSLSQMAVSITSPLLTAQYAELYESINALLDQHPAWQRIQILSPDGQQLYPLETGFEDIRLPNDTLIEKDILFQNREIGRIRLVVNFSEDIADAKQHFYIQALLEFGSLTLLIVLFHILLERVAIQPLKELVSGFRSLAEGDSYFEFSRAPANEVGEAMCEFYKMRTEIRDHQRVLEELRQKADLANQAKSDFLASMSHELRTPLNAILGLAELSASDESTSYEQQQQIRAIHGAGTHLLSLINNLLDLSAIESGNLKLSLEPVQLMDINKECLALTSVLADERNIVLETDIAALEGIVVQADGTRLKQVLLNLLSNAVKYNRPGGSVRVVGKVRADDRVCLCIEDTGPGLSEQQKRKLFRPFERLGVEQQGIEGTGIGLVITKELVEAMGGHLNIESCEGRGTVFWFELPIVERVSASNKQTESGVLTPPFSRAGTAIPSSLRILVAEDNRLNRTVISSQLATMGLKADFAEDGEQAWKAIQSTHYDMLLTDIQMPRLDGISLIERIRKAEQAGAAHMVIIALTANVMTEDVAQYFASGADDYLAKPTSLEALKSKLGEWSGRHTAGSEQALEVHSASIKPGGSRNQ